MSMSYSMSAFLAVYEMTNPDGVDCGAVRDLDRQKN